MTTNPCDWCDNQNVDPYDWHHKSGECRPIGIDHDGDTLCLTCGQFTNGNLIRWVAYPDGFTCVECGDVIADDNYTPEGGEEVAR